MKILIKSEKMKFFIILPTSLILNRLTAIIAIKIIKRKQPSINISITDLMELVRSIKKYKRTHRRLELVNITSANGENVFINF